MRSRGGIFVNRIKGYLKDSGRDELYRWVFVKKNNKPILTIIEEITLENEKVCTP